jgi:hypothetical protein
VWAGISCFKKCQLHLVVEMGQEWTRATTVRDSRDLGSSDARGGLTGLRAHAPRSGFGGGLCGGDGGGSGKQGKRKGKKKRVRKAMNGDYITRETRRRERGRRGEGVWLYEERRKWVRKRRRRRLRFQETARRQQSRVVPQNHPRATKLGLDHEYLPPIPSGWNIAICKQVTKC